MYYILALLTFIPILLLAHCRGMRRCASMEAASSIDCLSIKLAKIKVWVKDGSQSFTTVRPTPRCLYLLSSESPVLGSLNFCETCVDCRVSVLRAVSCSQHLNTLTAQLRHSRHLSFTISPVQDVRTLLRALPTHLSFRSEIYKCRTPLETDEVICFDSSAAMCQ